ncbi:uncharacterized protein LOC100258561 [Vitis vinifera]|uniref:Copper ion binding protein n=1 Tax=Vitis vinifera TaxID=29760 RepID=A0A438JMF4_VITVI|nr:uncharacterized protein LOC100258561 [Vitis vinifera]XP_019081155.1 uncharacterized protein LOC100258561 [Vitis vinifera]XP_019081156.1 uncharacterized protein LOC100258561 [Vitis vinifera]RVX10107.1 hypothetical protein CK203_012966 [Vitis vinifera]|eukprot:XP_002280136.1 PREDICTED: uncharacterized protein LOC100258561 [Vitis vinifera]
MIRISGIAKSKSCLSHQFIQKCFVSRTAKGKGKMKDGQPLKRSKITKKKGPVDAAAADRGPRNEAKVKMEQLENACLTAPTPIRYLTPKQKKREEEREKMGLTSNARRVELEMLKKNKSKKSELDSPMIIGTPGLDLISLGLVDAESIPKYELTVEDGRRLAKEYSRVLMRRHRARQAAESTILRLKKEAIEALPENLKAAALVPDLTPFPANRFMATLTPPIEGYIEKVMEAAKRSITKEKLR